MTLKCSNKIIITNKNNNYSSKLEMFNITDLCFCCQFNLLSQFLRNSEIPLLGAFPPSWKSLY